MDQENRREPRRGDRRRYPRGGRRAGDQPGRFPPLLVADRYDAARVPCAEYLDHFGFEVRQASDTQAALQSIRTTPPHLMLLELSLPGEAGLSLGEWLAKDAQARHIPVIVMSSAFQSNGASHPMPDHTAGVLVKPFPLATMLEEVRRALRSQAAPIAS